MDDVLPGKLARALIEAFESDPRKSEGMTDRGVHPIKRSVDLVLEGEPQWDALTRDTERVLEAAYEEALNSEKHVLRSFHEEFDMARTAFMIQRYRADRDDGYGWHIDSTPPDKRQLSCLCYLNTVDEGGETEFKSGLKVKPVEGRVLLFPPFWTHVHRGLRPISQTKYIMTWFVEAHERAL